MDIHDRATKDGDRKGSAKYIRPPVNDTINIDKHDNINAISFYTRHISPLVSDDEAVNEGLYNAILE